VTRMYSYNLDVGEHYYSPMTTYLDRRSVDRTARAETPGAMTFSERLQHRWINGRRYEGSARSASVARESGIARETSVVAAAESAQSTSAYAWAGKSSAAKRSVRAASEMPSSAMATAGSTAAAASRSSLLCCRTKNSSH